MLTSTIACHASASTASSGCPSWPRTPPALLTRMSIAPQRAWTASTYARTAARSVTSSRPAFSLSPGGASRAVTARASSLMSQAQTLAPRAAKAWAMARPNPCPAPVTIAVLSRNDSPIVSRRPGRKLVDVGAVERATALLHLVDHGGEPREQGASRSPLLPPREQRRRSSAPPPSAACGRRDRARHRYGISRRCNCEPPWPPSSVRWSPRRRRARSPPDRSR